MIEEQTEIEITIHTPLKVNENLRKQTCVWLGTSDMHWWTCLVS